MRALTVKDQPNILMIMSDSLSPHFLGAHGDPVRAMPNLDALAASGVVFENAYCNSPLCAPSRASMLTGRYVSQIGALDNANSFSDEWPTIGHVLGAAGYETVIAGKMHILGCDQHHGFDKRLALEADYTSGYDPGYFQIAYEWEQPSGGNPCGADWMGPSYVYSKKWDHYPRHYDADETIHRAAVDYLRQKTQDSPPFFCCASYHAPHNPFWIPDRFRDRFRGKDLPLPGVPEGIDTCHGPMDKWLNDFHYVPQHVEAMMTQENLRWLFETFYGVLADLDDRIGELMALLKARGLDDNTAVIFASDHGDMMGYRGMLQKRYLYDRCARVALFFSFPGRWQQGARIAAPVSLIDLLPTLAELAGAPVPDDLPGASLVPSVADATEPEDRVVFCEYHGEGVHAPCFMARKGDLKYIYVHGHEERLYNLADDPEEYVNLAGEGRYAPAMAGLKDAVMGEFDPEAMTRAALRSQRGRQFILRCAKERARRLDPEGDQIRPDRIF